MKLYSCYLCFLFVVFFSGKAASQENSQPERISGWQSDIDSLLALMRTQHYVYKSRPLPAKLIQNATELKTKIPAFSDERMLLELERLMWYLRDGHSYILPVARNVQTVYLPVQFYLFNNGTFIIEADSLNKDLIGCRVVRIHHVPIERLTNDMNNYVHQDNQYTVKWFAPTFLRFRGIYELYGLPANAADITIELVNQHQEKIVRKLLFIPATDFRGIPKLRSSLVPGVAAVPLYLSNVQNNFWFTHLKNQKQLYFQFNQVQDKENESLSSFSAGLDSVLKAESPGLLIIDVRHNNGGNLSLLTPLLKVLRHFETENPKSKMIVIAGRNTFSAAQVFISILNRDTHAIFAGEPSASSPNFVGEENYITLPWSGAMGSVSNKYHETIPGDQRKWIKPDWFVTLSSGAYFNNEDPVLDYIFKRMKTGF